MAREWAVVLDALSSAAAGQLGDHLRAHGTDVDVEDSEARVWGFATDEQHALSIRDRVLEFAESLSAPTLQSPPMVRVWSDAHHRYVDPAAPDEDPDTRDVLIDSELRPEEIRWRVRLDVESVFDFRRVRRLLPALRRPIIAVGNRHIDLGARDRDDASGAQRRARSEDVRDAG